MTFVGEAEALDQLGEAGFPVVAREAALRADEVEGMLTRLGGRVVAKMASPRVLHKSDVDGVRLGIQDESDLAAAFSAFDAEHRDRFDEPLPRMLVAQQLEGVEVFAGAKRDPTLGPVILFGLGGVLVELFDEVTQELAPITVDEARRMVARTRASELLTGYRGSAAANVDALLDLLVRLGRFVTDRPDVAELDCNPVIVGPESATIVDARMRIETPSAPPHDRRRLLGVPRQMLEPGAIAVVGASTDPAKPGGRVIRYLRDHGYTGRIVPVNPRTNEVQGLPSVAAISDLREAVDLAIIATPAGAVPAILDECAAASIQAAIVFSAGFAESGEAGHQHERELRDALERTSIRVAGPNCNGIVTPATGVMASFAGALDRPEIPSGRVALVTQSGAIGSSLISRSWDAGFGFSRWISTGNETDLTIADYLDLLATDERTASIALFIESIRDPEGFRQAAQRCLAAGIPVVAYKTGRSEVAQEVVASHTGALAGEDAVYDAFLRRCGVVRVRSLSELIDVSQVLARTPPPEGDRAGVLTMSGGAASVIADACESRGVRLPELDPSTQERLAAIIPPFGSHRNPIDATVDAVTDPNITTHALRELAGAPDIDLLLVQLTTNADPSSVPIAEAIVDLEAELEVPLLVARAGGDSLAPKGLEVYRRAGVPVFDYPERLVAAAQGVITYGRLVREHRERETRLGETYGSASRP